MPATLEGRTCLVTGATSGIGIPTARGLAALGATVLVHGRDRARTEAVARDVAASTGSPRVEPLVADLASLAQVRALAAEVRARASRLDLLVNNAGAIHVERKRSADGHELTFAVNHLAPFLLTNLLLEPLRAAAPSRVVTVSSEAHRAATLRLDDLMAERWYRGFSAYAHSKLANVLFTVELARRLEGTGVAAFAVHPGVVRTGFGRNDRGALSWLVRLAGPLMIAPESGARTTLYAATSPDLDGRTGLYLKRSRVASATAAATDPAAARALWEASERLVGLARMAA